MTITNDGIGPYGVTLSTEAPNAPIPDQDARVEATGSLSLLFDSPNNRNVAISFSGVLHTTHPTTVSNVVIASFD